MLTLMNQEAQNQWRERSQRALEITCHLLRRVFPPMYIGRRIAVVLESYGDESGTDDLSPYASFGGYLGDENQWKRFSLDWLAALRDLKLRELSPALEIEFHTSQFYFLAKEAGWPVSRIDGCVVALAEIIKRHTLMGFAALISTENYERAFSLRIKKRRLRDRYYLLFEQALKMQWRYLYYGRAGRERVAFFFDNKRTYETRAARIFDGLKEAFDTHNLLASRTFVSSTDFPPIQAADFVAYELRHFGRNGTHLLTEVTTAMNALKSQVMVHEFRPEELKMIAERLETQMRQKSKRA